MKKNLIFVMLLFIITGCSSQVSSNLKWFENLDEAIISGMKEENINKEDILGEIENNEEIFIFYKKKLEEGLGLGVASISKHKNKFAWYRSNQYVLVKNNNIENYTTKISFDIKTQSKKTFVVYVGSTKEQNVFIETLTKRKVSPQIDKNTGIYFYLEFKK